MNNLNSQQGFNAQNWQAACFEADKQGLNYVLVTLLGSAGSTPRSAGTKMLITANNIYDTVGGGHLEFVIIQKARQLLAEQYQGTLKQRQLIEHFPLSASLGQCCGGSTSTLFEVIESNSLQLDVYGAGHVAHALIQILSQLPINVRWIDTRAELFPESVASNIHIHIEEYPEDAVKNAVPDSAFLILTHNHQLDFSIAEQVLKRDDSCWLGVIGSSTKALRFQKRLSSKGFSPENIEHMQCPVGLSQVSGKEPMEVAVSMAGQIIELYQQRKIDSDNKDETQASKKRQGLQWKALQSSLNISPNSTTESDDATHEHSAKR